MILLFWDMCFVFGAIAGACHSPFLEANRDFYTRLLMYGFFWCVGAVCYGFASSMCELGDCKAHHGKVFTYMMSAFLFGLGGVGFMVNAAQRGGPYDVDLRSHNTNTNPGMISATQFNNRLAMHAEYEPVTMPQGPML